MYFPFQGKYYKEVEGVVMGSPVSPIRANMYKEHFKKKALRAAETLPGYGGGMWMIHS